MHGFFVLPLMACCPEPRRNRASCGLRNFGLFHEILYLILVLAAGNNLLNAVVFPPSDATYYVLGIQHELFLADAPQMDICLYARMHL